jgi:hypothetical protein
VRLAEARRILNRISEVGSDGVILLALARIMVQPWFELDRNVAICSHWLEFAIFEA